jgi:uncharacterized membrane protein YkvA (DUF1232 family)
LGLVASFGASNDFDSDNLVYDLDIKHVAVNDGEPPVLFFTECVSIRERPIGLTLRPIQTILRNNLTVRSILPISGLAKGGIGSLAEKQFVSCTYGCCRPVMVSTRTEQTNYKKKSVPMRPKAKSTQPLRSSNPPDTAHFGQVSPDVWKINGKSITIDQYIEDRRRDVSAGEICVLQVFTNRLREKLKELSPKEYLELHEMVHLLVRALESTAAENLVDPLPNWLAEVGFASSYLLERYDLIPDHVPGIGLADDTLILQRVISRNQPDLQRFLHEDNRAVSDEQNSNLAVKT